MNLASLLATAVTSVVIALQSLSGGPRPTTSAPAGLDAALVSRIDREVLEPLRDRGLRQASYSRAIPRWEPGTFRIADAPELADPSALATFRVERVLPTFEHRTQRMELPPSARTVWFGRVDRATGAIQLAPPSATGAAAPAWQPAADAIATARLR
jgi:hypothetical protein